MSLSPLKKLLKALLSATGLISALVGMIYMLSGLQAYISESTGDVLPFQDVLLSVGFLGLPVTGLLFYKSHKSFQRARDRYGLPDSPSRSLALTLLTVAATILTVSAFVIIVTVF